MNDTERIRLQCPQCEKRLRVAVKAAGTRVRCPECSKLFDVPVQSNSVPEPVPHAANALGINLADLGEESSSSNSPVAEKGKESATHQRLQRVTRIGYWTGLLLAVGYGIYSAVFGLNIGGVAGLLGSTVGAGGGGIAFGLFGMGVGMLLAHLCLPTVPLRSGTTGNKLTAEKSPHSGTVKVPKKKGAAAATTLRNWRVLSGADATREAVAQRVMSASDNFAAVLLTPVKPPSSSWLTLTGSITCHGCRGTCPLEEKVMVGGGLSSSIITCRCGSQITLMLTGASQKGAVFVVVSPWTSIKGEAVSKIGLRISKITAEGEGQQEGASDVRQFKGHACAVKCVAFTPDGLRALVGDGNGQLWLWDVASGRELRRWQGHSEGEKVSSVAVSSDGRRALSTIATT